MKRRVDERVVDVDRNESFKRLLEVGKNLMFLGNLAAGALIFGQSATGQLFDARATGFGAVILIFAYLAAWMLMKPRGR